MCILQCQLKINWSCDPEIGLHNYGKVYNINFKFGVYWSLSTRDILSLFFAFNVKDPCLNTLDHPSGLQNDSCCQ